MNEQKHTPGPWYLDTFSDGTMAIMPQVGFSICSLEPRAGFKRDIPNFHLMAAAPELLDALKEARSMLETASRYFPKSIRNSDRFSLLNVLANTVNPAIAKAEGKE